MLRTSAKRRVRTSGLLTRLGAVCGRTQRLIKASDILPLVVATYPRHSAWFAGELSDALKLTFPALQGRITQSYRDALDGAPPVVVADLRDANACTCLGHHHPSIAYSRLTRTIQADTGGAVGEIDLAVGAIRQWNPLPLAGLAAACNDEAPGVFEEVRFHAALLAVFLHEVEHVAYPERPETEVRQRSNRFFVDAVGDLLGREFGLAARAETPPVEQPHFA